MLQSIRDRATGWLAGVIVTLISIPFALWGLNQYFVGGQQTVVAEIDGQEISIQRFQQTFQQRLQRLRQMYGDRFDRSELDMDALQEQVLESMVRETLVSGAAQDLRLAVSDSDVAQRIYEMPTFQRQGEFSRELYRRMLSQRGMSVAGFEQRMRRSMASERLRTGLVNSALLTDRAFTRYVRLREQQRELAFLRVRKAALQNRLEVSEEAIREHYEANPKAYRTPERVKLDYVLLSLDEIAGEIEVSEEALREHYRQRRQQLAESAERRARHILFRPDAAGGDQQARERARVVRERIASGEIAFAEAARQYSQDPGSADEGGDLGWVSRGMMAEPFEEALFEMEEKGTVSPVVETDFGYHIIRYEGRRADDVPRFEEMRGELAAQLRNERARERIRDLRERLSTIAFEQPDSLRPAAEALDLSIRTTDWVTRENGSGLAQHQAVRDAAFSAAVLDQRENSELIELDGGRLVTIRVAEHQPAERKPLEAVRSQVERALRERKAQREAAERGSALLEKARAESGALEALADGEIVTYGAVGLIGRGAQQPSPQVVRQAFRVPRPQDDGPSLDGVQLPDGDYYVLAVNRIVPGDPGSVSAERRRNLRRRLERQSGSAAFDAFVVELRRRADVQVFPERIQ